jgi:hypothetical protein
MIHALRMLVLAVGLALAVAFGLALAASAQELPRSGAAGIAGR